jgi:GT2 family glycosyltransferase
MISILLATTGRPDQAEAFTRGLIETTEGHDIELVAAVDADNETARRLLQLDIPLRVRRVIDKSSEYRGSSKAWNDALAASTGDPVVLAADDLEWQPGWLDAALARLQEFPDGWGLVGFNDGHWGEELSTHYLMSRRFVREVLGGVIAWEAYRHSFNDREANARARAAGRYAWCENARVLHRHWLFGERPQDTTDTRLLGEHPESQRAFEQREAAGFPPEREPVIA